MRYGFTLRRNAMHCCVALLLVMVSQFISAKKYDKCRVLYTNQTACDNDNTTFGGCVWCDIVDHPPFCTEIYLAKQFPSPPQFPPWRCDKNITPGNKYNLRNFQ